jgi:hypothetical protein
MVLSKSYCRDIYTLASSRRSRTTIIGRPMPLLQPSVGGSNIVMTNPTVAPYALQVISKPQKRSKLRAMTAFRERKTLAWRQLTDVQWEQIRLICL